MLATATQATLRKLKKAVLVEMCEARELDTEGTKEQLSQWLIEWVCRHGHWYNPPSRLTSVDVFLEGLYITLDLFSVYRSTRNPDQ
jgi:hypothetical protein